ncbi:MAG: isocitrate/isopropylmalate dehydrogenase family protein [Candidatus Helarchaeota archaeon]|nr:isocitrate/isopropylmalate dehydrogenase family protein [Candidatus Helarchaeota archaeon]
MAKKVIALGGDGIGPLVVDATVWLLKEMKIPNLEIKPMPVGESAIETHGEAFPPETKQAVQNCDAILFGATEEKALQVIAFLRWGLGNYANIRPIKYYPGIEVVSPMKKELIENIDYVFVREGTEGMYAAAGREGRVKKLAKKGVINPTEVERWGEKAIYALRICSPKGTERIARFGLELCRKRKEEGVGKGLLEVITKRNVLRVQDKLWLNIITKIAEAEYPEIKIEEYFVDDFARRLLRYPDYHDTIIAENMIGDILTDMCAELVGGLGLAGSGIYGEKIPYFEPTHGSAPAVLARKNYAGEPVANPMATVFSAIMMLDYLKFEKEAKNLEKAVAALIADAKNYEENWKELPRDIVPEKLRKEGKFASTQHTAEAIYEKYKSI